MYSEKRSSGKKKIQKIVNDNGTVTMKKTLEIFFSILCIILDKTDNILCLLNDEEMFDLGTPQSLKHRQTYSCFLFCKMTFFTFE